MLQTTIVIHCCWMLLVKSPYIMLQSLVKSHLSAPAVPRASQTTEASPKASKKCPSPWANLQMAENTGYIMAI